VASVVTFSQGSSTSDASSYSTGSFSPQIGDLIVATITTSDSVSAGSLTSSSGAPGFVLIGSALRNSGASKSYMFVADAKATSGSPISLTFNCADDPATGWAYSINGLRGMAATAIGAGAVQQFGKTENGAAGTTPSVALGASVNSGNPVIATVANGSSPSGFTLTPTGLSAPVNQTYTTPNTGHQTAYIGSGFTSSSITWRNSSGSSYGAMAAEFAVNGPALISGSGAAIESGVDSVGAVGIVVVSGSGSVIESEIDFVAISAIAIVSCLVSITEQDQDSIASEAVLTPLDSAPGNRIIYVFKDIACYLDSGDVIDVIIDDCRVSGVVFENRVIFVDPDDVIDNDRVLRILFENRLMAVEA
jgi:hypothetical protein